MKQRYHLLDALRGFVILLMVAYHTAWDLIYIFGVNSTILRSNFGVIWQSTIGWTFITLSGFCWAMGKHQLRHGAICFGFGALMTVITLAVMPENRVVFGVLTLLGSCMMLMVPLDKILRKIPAVAGLLAACVAFLFTRNISIGTLGFGEWQCVSVPSTLYLNYFTAYLGFPQRGFYSTDYYPILPWIFLFCAGYFAYRVAQECFPEKGRFWSMLHYKIPPLGFLGRHSLVIYLFHQPVIYALLYVLFVMC